MAQQGPKKIGDIVANLLARRGFAQIEVTEQYQQTWQEIVGNVLAPLSRPGNLKRGVLEITVANSTAMQELTFRKRQLMSEWSKRLPDHPIKDLRFRVGTFT